MSQQISNTFEDCEQLSFSIGKCYVLEALMEFFGMADERQIPTKNAPNSFDEEQKDVYLLTVVEKFLDEFCFTTMTTTTTTTTILYLSWVKHLAIS